MISAIGRTIQPAARPIRRRVYAPGWSAGLPQRGVNRLRVSWLERNVNRAGVLVMEENFLPVRPAVFGAKDAALLVRAIRVSQHRHKNSVRIARINDNSSNLP